MKRLLSFLLLLPTSLTAQTVISGEVLDSRGEAVVAANVYLHGTYDGATTNETGFFTFTSSESGTQSLIVKHLEYAETSLSVSMTGDSLSVVIRMNAAERSTDAVVISAGSFSAGDKKKGVVLSKLDILTTAGSDGDIYAALETLPGTQTVGESGQLFVRGGAAYETRSFIDGMLVAQPYGSRLPDLPARGRFSPTLFSGTLFSTGAYSAEYGQALSSALILETEGLPTESVTGISLMTVGGGLSHTQRWENSSAQVSANYNNLGPYLSLMPQNTSWKTVPQGGDVMGNFRIKTGSVGMLKVLTMGSWSKAGMSRTALDQSGNVESFDIENTYGTGMVSWNGLIANKWLIDAGVSASTNEEPLALDSADFTTDQTFYQARVAGKRSINNKLYLKTGASLWWSDDEQSFVPHGETGLSWGYQERLSSAFTEIDWQPANNLAIRLGLRAEHSQLLDDVNLAPRFALAYAIGEKGQISLAGGRFYQSPQDPYLRLSQPLSFERADHLLLNYQWQSDRRTLRIEGYWKEYESLATSDQLMIIPGATIDNAGSGYARGMDVFWRDRETFDLLDYWVSYSFLDTEREYAHFDESVIPTFASKHNLSVVVKRYIPKITSQVGLTYSFASPRSYHDPNTDGWNLGRTPAYHNLALNISYLTNIFDQFTVVYASVSNVLGSEQIFGYRFSETPDPDGHFASEAIIPPAKRFAFVGVFISIGGNQF